MAYRRKYDTKTSIAMMLTGMILITVFAYWHYAKQQHLEKVCTYTASAKVYETKLVTKRSGRSHAKHHYTYLYYTFTDTSGTTYTGEARASGTHPEYKNTSFEVKYNPKKPKENYLPIFSIHTTSGQLLFISILPFLMFLSYKRVENRRKFRESIDEWGNKIKDDWQ